MISSTRRCPIREIVKQIETELKSQDQVIANVKAQHKPGTSAGDQIVDLQTTKGRRI